MKKSELICVLLLICFLCSACSTPIQTSDEITNTNSANDQSVSDNSDTNDTNDTNDTGVIENKDDKQEEQQKQQEQQDIDVRYKPDLEGLRVVRTLQDVLSDIARFEDDHYPYGICLVTLVDIDLNNCIENSDRGTAVPVTIRIDKIFEATSEFGFVENDTIKTTDYTVWFKYTDHYDVSYCESNVPLTETGKQYFVEIYHSESTFPINLDCDYKICGMSIPISDDIYDRNRVIEIYEKMRIPEDVQELSEGLIEKYLNAVG